MTPSMFWRLAFAQAAERDLRVRDHAAEEGFWRDHAPGYDERNPLALQANALVADLVALLRPSDRVLEIGPGSGAFTRRIAAHVIEIAGVEPSLAMRTELLRRWEPRFGIPPQLWAGRWEDAPELASDVVFGCNAFYRMEDIAASLSKMHRCAGRCVALVQSVGAPYAPPLRVRLNERNVERERAHALSDVLDELGIAHSVRLYSVERAPHTWGDVALISWHQVGAQPHAGRA
ncbi:MAG: class I SAM-dependent methyltransferase [Thermoanaerobaculia bacterium]|nr:class I SAM-dependent methyltransferase [Thermoanaerobaculia bacterium]